MAELMRTITPEEWKGSKAVRDEVASLCWIAGVEASKVSKIEINEDGTRAWLEVIEAIELPVKYANRVSG